VLRSRSGSPIVSVGIDGEMKYVHDLDEGTGAFKGVVHSVFEWWWP
jgi:hypothetical protein